MFRRLTALAISVTAVAGASASAGQFPIMPQPAAQQPRDKPGTAKTGTASIHGRIVATETGAAVKRARVTLASANPLDSRATTADLDGRYEFTELPAGSYRVTATKGLYVTLEYGQRRYYDRGKPIEVTEGQKVEKIDIALPRGAVISGVLLDDAGDPANGVKVTAMRQQFRNGKRVLVNVGRSVETNDLGQYRLYGLPAGTYYVSALPSLANPLLAMFSSPGGAPTYYPGTLSDLEAQRIIARVGQENALPDFTLVPSRLVKVSGTAMNATGGPAQAVMLMSGGQMPAAGTTELPGMTMAMVQPDGSFRLSNVAPGEYTIMATAIGPSAEPQVTSMPLTVAGEDIVGLALTATKGFQAKGQILFDEGAPPQGLSPSAVTLMAVPSNERGMAGGMGRATVRDDWSFEAAGLAGDRRFQLGPGLPAGWMVKSIFHRNTEITDKPLTVVEDVDGIVLTLTRRPASITGSVTNASGKPVNDCVVILFPDDAAQGPPQSQRYIRTRRPDDDGTFNFQQLPGTTYLAIAIETTEPGDEFDPDFLEQLRSQATRVSAGWGESARATLKLTPFERR